MKAVYKPKNRGASKLFENPFLEKLTKTHISAPIIVFLVISTILIYKSVVDFYSPWWQLVALFTLGYILFTLVEYLMHRFVYHMPAITESRKKFIYFVHGVHHEHPRDKERLTMPIPASLALSAVFFLLFNFMMGDLVFGFLPGFLMGYVWYLWVHYMIHAFQPPKNFFKVLWVHHGIHHYKQQERAFGVSWPIWDMVFRTMPK